MVNILYNRGISVELTRSNIGYQARIGDAYGEPIRSIFDDVTTCFKLSTIHIKRKFNVDSVKEVGLFHSDKSMKDALLHAITWIENSDPKWKNVMRRQK